MNERALPFKGREELEVSSILSHDWVCGDGPDECAFERVDSVGE